MPLIHEIQRSLLEGKADLASLLLKVRFLASKLGSHPLEAWVKHEAEGYPVAIELPEYRELDMAFRGTFSGPFGSGITNAPILPFLIERIAGKNWSRYSLRQSVAAIDQLVSADTEDVGGVHLDLSNLIILVQGKVYPGYACNEVKGFISTAQLMEVQHVVRNRILELTLELERSVAGVDAISVGSDKMDRPNDAGKINQIFYQTVHGSMTNVSNSGSIETLNVTVTTKDDSSVSNYLQANGILKEDANEFASIIASEHPSSKEEPFGTKARIWVGNNLQKAASGVWKVGIATAGEVLKKAALGYYGL